jgi:hypothetical protein
VQQIYIRSSMGCQFGDLPVLCTGLDRAFVTSDFGRATSRQQHREEETMGTRERGIIFAGLLAAALSALPAVAGSLYAWRSEDGVYSYTDDRNAVPERYRGSAQVSESKSLEDYDRFTVQVGSPGPGREARLHERLQALREANKQFVATASSQDAAAQQGAATVSLGSAGPGQPRVELSAADPNTHEPIVIEPLITRRPGDLHTRRSTVIRQGDRTLVIVKGDRRQRSPTSDVIDERDL